MKEEEKRSITNSKKEMARLLPSLLLLCNVRIEVWLVRRFCFIYDTKKKHSNYSSFALSLNSSLKKVQNNDSKSKKQIKRDAVCADNWSGM